MDFIFEFEKENEKFNLECKSLWRAYEMTEIKHRDMIDRANYKLMTESGTYEDAMWLYEEANAETNQNKQGILQRIGNAIRNFIKKLKRLFKGDDAQQAINGIDPNRKYSGSAAPGINGPKDIQDHHNKITEIINSVKNAFTSKMDELPDNIKNLGSTLFNTTGAVATVVVGGDIIKSALKYAQGDANALNNAYDWLQKQIDKIPDNDGEKINWTKSILERFQELVTKESSWSNTLLGWVSSKVEGGLEKINTKSASAIRNSKEYKDLVEKQAAGTITPEEKKKLDDLEAKASKKDDKAAEHGEKKEKSQTFVEFGKLDSNVKALNSLIKKTINKLTEGSITPEVANKEKSNHQKELDKFKKLYEDNKNDKRISQSNKDSIEDSIKEAQTAMDNLIKAIDKLKASDNDNAKGKNSEVSDDESNSNDAEKVKTSDNGSSDNSTNSNEEDTDDTSDDESNDDNNEETTDEESSSKSLKGVTPKKFTGNEDDNVVAYRLKNGKLKNANSRGRRATVKEVKGFKNAVYGKGPKGDAWYYEDTEDDWFDINVDNHAVFEAYSGALDDELLDILNEL